MSQTPFLSRGTSHPTCWSRAGNDPARSEPLDRHPHTPDAMPKTAQHTLPHPLMRPNILLP